VTAEAPIDGHHGDDPADLAPPGAGGDGVPPPGPGPPGGGPPPGDAGPIAAPPDGTRPRLSPREHTLFVGVSQSGKTTLARDALARFANWVIIDTKREDFNDWDPTEDPAEILRRPRCVFQPPLSAMQRHSKDWSDPFSQALAYIWNVRAAERPRKPSAAPLHRVTVYVDEGKIAARTHAHPLIDMMAVQGMGRGVGLWVAMQGTHGVSTNIIDNAIAAFYFRIHNAAQRGSLAANLDTAAARRLGKLAPHDFAYWRQGMGDFAGPFNLRTMGKARAK
jgi:hypothetical protein